MTGRQVLKNDLRVDLSPYNLVKIPRQSKEKEKILMICHISLAQAVKKK